MIAVLLHCKFGNDRQTRSTALSPKKMIEITTCAFHYNVPSFTLPKRSFLAHRQQMIKLAKKRRYMQLSASSLGAGTPFASMGTCSWVQAAMSLTAPSMSLRMMAACRR